MPTPAAITKTGPCVTTACAAPAFELLVVADGDGTRSTVCPSPTVTEFKPPVDAAPPGPVTVMVPIDVMPPVALAAA